MRAVSLGGKANWDSKGNLSPGGNDTDSEGPPAQGAAGALPAVAVTPGGVESSPYCHCH